MCIVGPGKVVAAIYEHWLANEGKNLAEFVLKGMRADLRPSP